MAHSVSKVGRSCSPQKKQEEDRSFAGARAVLTCSRCSIRGGRFYGKKTHHRRQLEDEQYDRRGRSARQGAYAAREGCKGCRRRRLPDGDGSGCCGGSRQRLEHPHRRTERALGEERRLYGRDFDGDAQGDRCRLLRARPLRAPRVLRRDGRGCQQACQGCLCGGHHADHLLRRTA